MAPLLKFVVLLFVLTEILGRYKNLLYSIYLLPSSGIDKSEQ